VRTAAAWPGPHATEVFGGSPKRVQELVVQDLVEQTQKRINLKRYMLRAKHLSTGDKDEAHKAR
jgi:hypothetical protein